MKRHRQLPRLRRFAAAVAALLSAAALAKTCLAAEASLNAEELKVYSPGVTYGEREVEYRGFATGAGQQGFAFSASYSPTSYWESEAYEVLHRDPGGPLVGDKVQFEERFQLAPPGEYWADPGAIFEVEIPERAGDPVEEEFTPILEKQFGRLVLTLNPSLEWQSGSNYAPGTGFHYAGRAEYLLSDYFAPAAEFYGEPGVIGNFPNSSEQTHMAGPAFYGTWRPGSRRTVNYSAALLFGLNAATPVRAVVTRLEFEF
ncbi:MAG TPA: hypothetical protein VNH15_00180 [Elusimicrobiota bacterium]|nr:hypothetical protein [Elusimicrobiota bacterium]